MENSMLDELRYVMYLYIDTARKNNEKLERKIKQIIDAEETKTRREYHAGVQTRNGR